MEIENPEFVVENEIQNGAEPVDVAMTYSLALRKPRASVDWQRINKAISDKWSKTKLLWVKTRAWEYVNGDRKFGE